MPDVQPLVRYPNSCGRPDLSPPESPDLPRTTSQNRGVVQPGRDGYLPAEHITVPRKDRAAYDGTVNPSRDGWLLPGG